MGDFRMEVFGEGVFKGVASRISIADSGNDDRGMGTTESGNGGSGEWRWCFLVVLQIGSGVRVWVRVEVGVGGDGGNGLVEVVSVVPGWGKADGRYG
ncbi:hypothetical protein Acr_08g0002850 [Actinidia rufa]|uniref:Uncharacterized protein n=1 Tax=Actinidia rufa TaxID=165716 RepID=A0A7J0F107_9ERIC|nr:hypothetical protein Acr_08g0002850 [Actinidia rufa]